MYRTLLIGLVFATQAGIALAQTSSGSAGGGSSCPNELSGEKTVDQMIAEAGSIEHLYDLNEQQLEFNKGWLVDTENAIAELKAMGINSAVAQAEDVLAQGREANRRELELNAALKCRLGIE